MRRHETLARNRRDRAPHRVAERRMAGLARRRAHVAFDFTQ